MEDIFSEDDMKEAKRYGGGLGPHYFSARRFTDGLMESKDWGEMQAIVSKAAEAFTAKLQDAIEYELQSNAEMNVQSFIHDTVNRMMEGILSGEQWIMDKYALGQYGCEKARAAIARHIPDEIAKARIADLETQVQRLTDDLRWFRER